MVFSSVATDVGRRSSIKPMLQRATKSIGFAMVAVACSSSTFVPTANAMAIPERMQLTEAMKTANLKQTKLVPIDLAVGVQEMDTIQGEEAIMANTGTVGSIAFVVRRPG